MAANKFATVLHRNTNKITLILVYAILEWVLILLLLLNSLFSFLIVKYAEYFGLKRPCLWCTRLDHIFDSTKKKNSYRDLVCDDHATEISKLGFCLNHRRLSESQDMCDDCSSSSDSRELSKNYAFFPWMKQIGMIQGSGEVAVENGEVDSKCSCCGVNLEEEKRKLYSSYVLIQPSWEVLDYTQKGNLIKEAGVDCGIDDGDNSDDHSRSSEFVCSQVEDVQRIEETEENYSSSVSNSDCKEVLPNEDEKVDSVTEKEEEHVKEDDLNVSDDQSQIQSSCGKDLGVVIAPKHIEFYIEGEDFHLIPVEMMDTSKAESKNGYKFGEEVQGNCGNEDVILDFSMHDVATQFESVASAELESLQVNESEWSSFIQAESEEESKDEQEVAITTPSTDADNVQEISETKGVDMESDENQVSSSSDVLVQLESDEVDAEISIGTEIPDHDEPVDDIHTQEILHSSSELQEDNDDHDCKQTGNDVEFRTITIETSERAIDGNLPLSSELNGIEEEKVPDTPTSIDSLHQLHKKLLLLERIETGTEDSLDGGSVISDIDGVGDGTLTVDKLKSALRVERKQLNALYTELEEERSASAVAANQTMAMINRLQEEKAAVQMEALQYQRMMEEQSEYDQEALQLLNELMVKREREKAEIEKELEIYRKKVQDYEAKERIMMLRRRSGTSSVSCSNAEDSDGLSIDFNHEAKEEDSFENHEESSSQNTPADAVVYLEESLANFEDERLLILEQLKGLEEKLFTLNDGEEQHFDDIKPVDDFYKETGNGSYNDNHDFSIEANGVTNGQHFKEINGKLLPERKIIGAKAKRLLPLFDAETEDGVLNGNELEFDSVASQNSSVTKSELDSKRFPFEEEVDHVYERLQALEADREFLRHCISSLRKGDKGLYLLQEILQHLRDLRNVELRAKNFGDLAS
ncbi:hypothetical protein Dsin_009042 [Dipteronia sinensis]|uniref:GTD-binding domain-containing protein n=1 Tax=Dipteronia sinensis TaxID=43782 RepID=A0AAE0AQ71_9ROSI|nr:hypothetical protein Dsin_009042 [Dipteronia sinensis]